MYCSAVRNEKYPGPIGQGPLNYGLSISTVYRESSGKGYLDGNVCSQCTPVRGRLNRVQL